MYKNIPMPQEFIPDLLERRISLLIHPIVLRHDKQTLEFVRIRPSVNSPLKSRRKPFVAIFNSDGFEHVVPCPWGSIGDTLRVLESVIEDPKTGGRIYWPKGDDAPAPGDMPVSFARIFLEIKDIYVKRLHEVSDEEIQRTGCDREEFQRRWARKHGVSGIRSWTANPWVWCFSVEPGRKQ